MRPTTLKLLIPTLLLACYGLAEEYDTEEMGRGVARVSLINGDVSVKRGDSGDWVAAAVNAPLVVEDSVFTGPSARAEVQFDSANMVRLAANSEIRLAQLDNQRYIIQVARGTVTFRVQRDSDADVEISTPSVSVRPVKRGSYRVTVREDGESEITVRSGEAEIFTPRGAERLQAGRTMFARGTTSDPEFRIAGGIPEDSWDRWNEQRDRYFNRTQGYRYADRSIYGIDDLDDYGAWANVAPYGWCWYPRRVAAGWSPYYSGRWAWVDWYGWTWISYEPWGWAPYHYGRWFYERPYGWCWYPGGYRVRHHWQPALVAFFGWGGRGGVHAGIGFGWGHVGWVPLAPYEPYYPWYGRRYYRGYGHGTYVDNSVNIVNNINITNIYRNARVTNAVTAVDAGQFGQGNGNLIRVRGGEVDRVGLVKGQLPVAPGRESLRLANREVQTANLPRTVDGARFYSRNRPAPVERVPFEQQRRSIEEMSRRGTGEPGMRTAETVRGAEPSVRGGGTPEATPRTPAGSIARTPDARGREATGLRRTEESTAPAVQDRGGWRRFGDPVYRQQLPRAEGGARTVEREPSRGVTEPSVRTGAVERDTGGWRRFEGRSATEEGTSTRGMDRSRSEDRGEVMRRQPTETPRRSEGREFGSPSRSTPRVERSDRQDSIRISPPIVRERQAAPRYEAPARVERAPEARGGGESSRGVSRGGGESRGSARNEGGGGRGNDRNR